MSFYKEEHHMVFLFVREVCSVNRTYIRFIPSHEAGAHQHDKHDGFEGPFYPGLTRTFPLYGRIGHRCIAVDLRRQPPSSTQWGDTKTTLAVRIDIYTSCTAELQGSECKYTYQHQKHPQLEQFQLYAWS